jgi:predicted RNA-binding protein with PIN domain
MTRVAGSVESTVDNRLLPLVRPALEHALGVARAGAAADPPVAPPKALLPYLRFAKLPRPALMATRKVLDEDDAFRARVVEQTDEYEIGLACWLFLARPDGWETDLKELAVTYDENPVVADRRARSEARRAARQQQAELEARTRLEERAARAEDEAARMRIDLADAKRQLRDMTTAHAAAAGQLEQRERERTDLLQRAKDAEARLTERSAESRAMRRELDELKALLAASEARLAAAAAEVESTPPLDAAASGDSAADLGRASQAVAAAAEAAGRLAEALGVVAASLAPTGAAPPVSGVAAVGATGPEPVRRRIPPRLGGGLVDDTVAAGLHLARMAGVRFLIDGYNVSKTGWPELDLPEQRLRLVNALNELHARLGTQVEVVFDGVNPDVQLRTRALPAGVQVWFSPEDREADDVVLDRIGACPASAPVVVVSSDRRVRSGARAAGAAVLSSSTLLGLLR